MKKRTINEVSKKWYDTYKNVRSYNSNKRYSEIINKHILPYFDNVNIAKIEPHQIQQLINLKHSERYTRTVELILMTLKQIFEFAVMEGYINKNVAKYCKLPKIQHKQVTALTDEQIEVIKEVAKAHRYGDFILALLYTGMRRQEIIALKWSDVDFDNNVIHISRAVEFIGNYPKEKTTKSKYSVRDIPLVKPLKDLLLKRKKGSKSPYIWSNAKRGMITLSAIETNLKTFISACRTYSNDSDFTFTYHQLRHTFTSSLYKANVGIKEAQEILGHSDFKITMNIYNHLNDSQKKVAYSQINEYFS